MKPSQKSAYSANSNNKILKLNSLIQRELGSIVPPYLENLEGFTTISKVDVSRDKRWAKVWVSIINGDDDKILETIKENIYEIQGEINSILNMKMTPRLQFYLDTSPRYAQHIEELIQKIHEEDEQ